MKMLLRGFGILFGIASLVVHDPWILSANHLPIGSRCGGCRWTGDFFGQS